VLIGRGLIRYMFNSFANRENTKLLRGHRRKSTACKLFLLVMQD
jgi:hypothetical protein